MFRVVSLVALLPAFAACGSSGDSGSDGSSAGTAGAEASGGNDSAGDIEATGGSSAESATGGASSTNVAGTTGEPSSTGGSSPTGGATSTGGAGSTGGSNTGGGSPSLGGASATGGTPASGGTSTTGGANATGGGSPTGGANATGGTDEAGGTGDSGGSGSSDPDPESDCAWSESDATQIALSGTTATSGSDAVTIDGAKVTIAAAGTYVVSGELTDGQIVVAAATDGVVRLVLSGASIASSSGAPIAIEDADRVALILVGENQVSDGASYTTLDEDGEPNAAVYTRADMTVCGTGTLGVTANYNDGIASKDGLVIRDATLSVTAIDDGIRGKDYLEIQSGNITVNAGGDGLKSDNDEDATLGFVTVGGGTLTVTAEADAIDAYTTVNITGGTLNLNAGGGSQAGATDGAKGVVGPTSVVIDGGTITVDSADDAIHSNATVAVNNGALELSTGDDGIHADTALTIGGGTIDVLSSYEGLEAALITVNDGTIHVSSSDDGVNVAGGSDGSGTQPGMPGEGFGGTNSSYQLIVNGGYLYVDASGDGLDSNGTCTMTAGTVIVNGPTQGANAALDCGGSFAISGGFLVSVHMQMMGDEIGNQTQNLVKVGYSSSYPADTLIHIEDSAGNALLTYAPPKSYKALVFTSPDLVNGTYSLYSGGSSTGTEVDGLFTGGEYTPGTLVSDFTVSGTTTQVGSSSGGPGFPGG